MALLAVSIFANYPAFAANPSESYLSELQGSLQDITAGTLRNAPAQVSFNGCKFRLDAGVFANLMPGRPRPNGLHVGVTVTELGKKHIPQGTTLEHLWLVRPSVMCQASVWYRDLRTVKSTPGTCRWYTIDKRVNDGPMNWVHDTQKLKVVVGIKTPEGKLVLLGSDTKIGKAY